MEKKKIKSPFKRKKKKRTRDQNYDVNVINLWSQQDNFSVNLKTA